MDWLLHNPIAEIFGPYSDSTVERLNLAPAGMADLCQVAHAEIAACPFAQSQTAWRRERTPAVDDTRAAAEVRDALPRTRRPLPPAGIQKHLDDALAFARFLGGWRNLLEPPTLACLGIYEATSLEVRNSDRMLCVRFLRYRPGQMIARCSEADAEPLASRRCLAIWFRTSRRHRFRHWVLPSGD